MDFQQQEDVTKIVMHFEKELLFLSALTPLSDIDLFMSQRINAVREAEDGSLNWQDMATGDDSASWGNDSCRKQRWIQGMIYVEKTFTYIFLVIACVNLFTCEWVNYPAWVRLAFFGAFAIWCIVGISRYVYILLQIVTQKAKKEH